MVGRFFGKFSNFSGWHPIAGFDQQLFADPSTGGDLRFYDQNHDESLLLLMMNASG